MIRRALSALLCASSCASSFTLPDGAEAQEPTRRADAGGMHVSWRWEDEQLHLLVRAPTTGWVAVGLNDRAELDGSLLIMCAVVSGAATPTVRCEEHIARPPDHPSRRSLGGRDQVHTVRGAERDGATEIAVTMSVVPDTVAPPLRRGQRVHMTLAWSAEKDFNHHSRMRTMVEVVL
ncbi:MAG: hypothetical protein ACKV2T_29770 [Kofleriaceae bacterium]